MIGKLEFNLPEDEDAFKLAQRGVDYFSVLHNIKNELRNWYKYGQSAENVLKAIRDLVNDAPMDDIR